MSWLAGLGLWNIGICNFYLSKGSIDPAIGAFGMVFDFGI
jgi:hypothetical protein